jgi:tRNA-specific 2-thiouridylase
MKKRVLMAMSGGIDSSVAAILLLEQGYELVGVTFRTFDSIKESCIAKEKGCCSVDSIMEAKHLAEKLGFEHHILDARKEFRETVIQNFIDEYMQCHTPNPCVLCNKVIKWGLLFEMAKTLGCDYLATGHYAQIEHENGRYFLRQGADVHKDQSYFLWRLSQEALQRTLFPLGGLTKAEVRKIALDHGFVKLSEKKESEEICFIPDNNYRNFLEKEVPDLHQRMPQGNFVGVDGKILGKHCGIYNYTIGQRKGLGIALGAPAYVLEVNTENNTVMVGTDKSVSLIDSLTLHGVEYMKLGAIPDGFRANCKVRYRGKMEPIECTPDGSHLIVRFLSPIERVAIGQSVVIYDGADVVCGGIVG